MTNEETRLPVISKSEPLGALFREQMRIAHDSHDIMAQSFVAIMIHLGVIKLDLSEGPSEVLAHLDQVREFARHGLKEARRSVGLLQPEILGKNSLSGAFLRMAYETILGTELPVKFELEGVPYPLPEDWESPLIEMGKSVLALAMQYSEITQVTIQLTYTSEQTQLRFDEIGHRDNSSFWEIHLVKYGTWARHLGGTLSIAHLPQQGTEITLILPVAQLSTSL